MELKDLKARNYLLIEKKFHECSSYEEMKKEYESSWKSQAFLPWAYHELEYKGDKNLTAALRFYNASLNYKGEDQGHKYYRLSLVYDLDCIKNPNIPVGDIDLTPDIDSGELGENFEDIDEGYHNAYDFDRDDICDFEYAYLYEFKNKRPNF